MGLPADLRYSARSFARAPGFTAALLLTIALGIGGNAAVYGFVRGLIVRDTRLAAREGFVSLYGRDASREATPLSYSDYLSLQKDRAPFEWLGLARELQSTMVRGDRSAIVTVAAISPELAAFLDLSFDEGVVIGHRLWVTEFRNAATARGEVIRIDDVQTRVAALMPDWFEGLYVGRNIDVWVPLRDESMEGIDRSSRSWLVFGRLRQGVSVDDARRLINASRGGSSEIGVMRYTGMSPEMSDGLARVGTLLSLAALAVFFIACGNVASFLMGRASARTHETSLRVALGVSRGQLVRQLLSDSVLVSLTGTAFGVLLAIWTLDVVPALLFVEDAGRLVFAPDWTGIAGAATVCAGITIACGLMPLLEVRHDRPAAILQRESLGPSPGMRRLRAGLVIAQMTCCCILVIAASLLVQGLRSALQTGVAHRLGQPILATVQTPPDIDVRYFEEIERTALAVPGMFGTAWTARLPGNRPAWQAFRIEPAALPLRDITIDIAPFTADSLPQIRLPPVAGRMFGARDTPSSCRVAIVNEEAAAEFGGNPVGRSIVDVTGQTLEVIGTVATRKKAAAVSSRPTIYYYANQQSAALGRIGPASFRVPASLELTRAVLDAQIVSPSYFDAMGVSTIAGEVFSGNRAQRACRVAVVNREAAEQYFGGNAVGAAVLDGLGRRTEIIGVVQADLLRTFQRRGEPAIYFPMADEVLARMTLVIGSTHTTDDTVSAVRRKLDLVSGAALPPDVRTLDTYLTQTALAPLRIATVLVGVFAAIALALGIVGLYGALSDAARQRRREIAVRILLGAQGWRVIRQVVGEGGRLAGAGTVAGMLASVVATRSLTRVTPTGASASVWVWMAAPVLLLGAVAIASVLPAFRALAVDPLSLTRDDR
jgi:ABC-type antimicrobial peptide transport system permease subunit